MSLLSETKEVKRLQRKKEFCCDLCPYKSTLKANVTRHHLTHTGEKPYRCDLCSFRSAGKNNLTRHGITKHSRVEPYQCGDCSFETTRKDNLVRHEKTHVRNKFRCEMCYFTSGRKIELLDHYIKSRHS